MRNFLTTPDRTLSVWDLINEVDRTFNEGLNQISETKEASFFNPQVDVEESDGLYMISVDLPGVKKDEVKIEVNDGVLKVSGHRSLEKKSQDKHFNRFERKYGSFERSFRLPTKIDEAKIQAHYENGVLEILVPKVEMAQGRTVQIQSGKGGLFSKFLGSKTEGNTETPKDNH